MHDTPEQRTHFAPITPQYLDDYIGRHVRVVLASGREYRGRLVRLIPVPGRVDAEGRRQPMGLVLARDGPSAPVVVHWHAVDAFWEEPTRSE